MRRKLIPQGKGGSTVYIPKPWLDQKGLKAGDDIEIIEQDDNLLISTKKGAKKETTLHFDKMHKMLIRTTLSAYYRLGYSKITIESKEDIPFDLIQSIITSLRGYELVDQREKMCVIEDISDTQQDDVNKIIIRFFQMINWLYTGFAAKDKEQRYQAIIKWRDYCQRRIVQLRDEASHEYYSYVLAMEKIASSYRRLASLSLRASDKETLAEIHGLFMENYKLFMKQDFNHANKLYLKILHARIDFLENPPKVHKAVLAEGFYILQLLRSMSSRLLIIISLQKKDSHVHK